MAISEKEIAYRFVKHVVESAFSGEDNMIADIQEWLEENYPNSRWTPSREKKVTIQIEKCLERMMRPIDGYLEKRG
jgi:hypothetical protein